MYLSDIRAAISSGQRPTAVILNDAYAGHRKWWDPAWLPTPSLASVWTEWDFILLRVYQYIEDYTTPNGQLVWVEEDPDVAWEITKVESFLDRERHLFRESNEVKDWESLRSKPVWDEDVEPPSMEKWLKRIQEEEEGGWQRPAMGRPPTPEELAAMNQSEG